MSEKCVSKTQVGEATDTDDGTKKYSRRNFMETAAATGGVGAAVGLAGCSGNGGDGGSDRTSAQDFLWWTTRGFDILLRLKAEESRAVGVSGLTVAPNSQSVRICRAVHGLWRVGLLGVPSPRYSYPPSYRDSWCCFCHGSPTDFNGLGVTFCGACKQSGTASVHCRNRPFT